MEQHDGIKVTINRRRNNVGNNRPTNSFSSRFRQGYSGVTTENNSSQNTFLSMIRNYMSSVDPQYDSSIYESTLTPLESTLTTTYDFPTVSAATYTVPISTYQIISDSIFNPLTNNIDIPGLVFLTDNETKKDDSITIDIEESEYEEDTSTDCTVCFVEINKGEKVVKLDCEHIFHRNCIDEWVKYKQECPNCRKEIKVKRN